MESKGDFKAAESATSTAAAPTPKACATRQQASKGAADMMNKSKVSETLVQFRELASRPPSGLFETAEETTDGQETGNTIVAMLGRLSSFAVETGRVLDNFKRACLLQSSTAKSSIVAEPVAAAAIEIASITGVSSDAATSTTVSGRSLQSAVFAITTTLTPKQLEDQQELLVDCLAQFERKERDLFDALPSEMKESLKIVTQQLCQAVNESASEADWATWFFDQLQTADSQWGKLRIRMNPIGDSLAQWIAATTVCLPIPGHLGFQSLEDFYSVCNILNVPNGLLIGTFQLDDDFARSATSHIHESHVRFQLATGAPTTLEDLEQLLAWMLELSHRAHPDLYNATVAQLKIKFAEMKECDKRLVKLQVYEWQRQLHLVEWFNAMVKWAIDMYDKGEHPFDEQEQGQEDVTVQGDSGSREASLGPGVGLQDRVAAVRAAIADVQTAGIRGAGAAVVLLEAMVESAQDKLQQAKSMASQQARLQQTQVFVTASAAVHETKLQETEVAR
jgi:hypothetical protein